MGYRLCAFLDADEPLEIFRRLLVGSEGTLAYVPEVVFETVPQPVVTTTSWVHFPGIDAAVAPVGDLVASGATAVELMVAPALIAAGWNMVGAPPEFKELDPTGAALLIEFGGASEAELSRMVARAEEILAGHTLLSPATFSSAPEIVEINWRVREGLHGLVGRLRPAGTSLIVEDVCVPPARIAEGARDLQALLLEHGFAPGVAGHASAGNLHFMLTPDFSKEEDVERYEALMAGLVELIVDKYDGSLKAEHGTGVNMAPYVEREWGAKATELMWRVKRLADPDGVLNPGVVLNRDPGVHLRDLKTTPPIEESATACVECGFCEPVCPSRDLTTTPRQRIVLRREIARQPTGSPLQEALLDELGYEVLDTCAADGSCQLACPVGIDTGKLVKELRAERHTERGERTALAAAKRWGAVESASRTALRVGGPVARRTNKGRALPGPAEKALPATTREGAAAVYVPSCTNRIFGGGPIDALVAVSARAGLPVWIPGDVAGSCCGLPWSSKGFGAAHRHKANEMVERLWDVERRRRPADRHRRRLLHRLDRRTRGGDAERGERRAPGGADDPRLGRLGPRPPAAEPQRHPQGRGRGDPPDLRHPPPRPGIPPRRPRRGDRRRRLRPTDRDLLRLRRRPRHLQPRADRQRHPPRGHRARRARSGAARASTPT